MMDIRVTGLRNLTEDRQQQIGQAILITLFQQNVEVDGVAITFEEE